MGLTQVSKDGVKNDAIDASKLPANSVGASELADNAVDTNAIANNAVTAGKLASGVQTTINNNADNRVITGSGTANTLNGESLLTYDGNNLNVLSGVHDGGLAVEAANANQETRIQIKAKASDDTNHIFQLNAKRSANRLDIVGGSQTRASLLSTGEFGIGTVTQQSLLQVGGGTVSTSTKPTVNITPSSGNAMLTLRGGSPQIFFDITSGGNPKIYTDGADLTISNGNLDSAGNERFRFRADGGLCFNGDTAAANALDDYEEGTWTPTFDGNAATNTSNNCRYIKIGNVVHCFFRATHPTTSSSSYATITGLPFTSVGFAVGVPGGAFAETNAGANLSMIVNPNGTYAYILKCDDSGVAVVTQSSISGKDFRGCITYHTS